MYGLCGGHIQPLWDAIARTGIRIVDTRSEQAACMMAHAEAALTDAVGVAIVTAGPGVTNAITGIANAESSQVPIVVLAGMPPRPQLGKGAMQELPQRQIVGSLCRFTASVLDARDAAASLDEAFRAAAGRDGAPGPAFVEIPTDVLVEPGPPALVHARREESERAPDPDQLAAACELIEDSRRPIVIGGRGVRAAAIELDAFLTATGALYLDGSESRGALPQGDPASVPAVRGRAMREADLVITLGRRLNFQLAYGSRAAFDEDGRLLRVGTSSAEVADNRRADVELRCDVRAALAALVRAGARPQLPDDAWREELQARNAQRERDLFAAAVPGEDGRMHPLALIRSLNEFVDDDTVTVADGGDILSFARIALRTSAYLDSGALGCLGVGVPFAIAASLAHPGSRVIALVGDGSFGFTAMEIDTAVRHDARALFVVANNEGWNIERKDQEQRFEGRLVGVELPGCRYDLLATSLGARGRRVEREEELTEAIRWGLDNAPAVLDVLVTGEAESPDFRNGLAQVPARQALVTWDELESTLSRSTRDASTTGGAVARDTVPVASIPNRRSS